MSASLLDISSVCTLSADIDHESQSVNMLKTLEFQRRIHSLDLELEYGSDEDNEITDASTVEADDILKTPDLNLQLAEATPVTSVELSKDVTPQLPKYQVIKRCHSSTTKCHVIKRCHSSTTKCHVIKRCHSSTTKCHVNKRCHSSTIKCHVNQKMSLLNYQVSRYQKMSLLNYQVSRYQKMSLLNYQVPRDY